MERVTRVGVSFEPELLKRFDALTHKRGYNNRSRAIRDILREELAREALRVARGHVVATLTIIYEHRAGVTQRLLELQHHHHAGVLATTHIHIDERRCLEVLVLRGDAGEVRSLAQHIRALRGVELGELVMLKS
ncbi:MAG: nickel-responsive transcriptional regulator NikR [Thermoplasmata archaeon]